MDTGRAPQGVGRVVAGGAAAGIVTVGVLLFLLARLDLSDEAMALLHWVDGQGTLAPLVFMTLMALVVVFLLPGILLTTGAGFLFGVVPGSVYVVVGTTAGAAVSFLISRWCLGGRAARWLRNHPRMQMLDADLAPDGWKIVLLCRLIPFFPSKLANYFFGLTSVSLPAFVGGTAAGIVPYTVHNVYLGAIAADLARHSFRPADISATRWVLYAAGLAVAIAAMVILARRATRALQPGSDPGSGSGSFPGSDPKPEPGPKPEPDPKGFSSSG
jgi:uncharacterized membrane protein YdjX (TVP38/TMEM64 family)